MDYLLSQYTIAKRILKYAYINDTLDDILIAYPDALKFVRYYKYHKETEHKKLDDNQLKEMYNLKVLEYSKSIENDFIMNFNNITQLYCCSSNIYDFSNFKNLKKLVCRNCSNINEIKNIPMLEYLDCSDCKNIKVISNLDNLQLLVCNSCKKLKTIDLKNIKKLYCRKNYFNNIENLTSLTHLDLSETYIFKKLDLNKLINLEYLIIYGDDIDFNNLYKLKYLEVFNNNMVNTDNLINLEYLSLLGCINLVSLNKSTKIKELHSYRSNKLFDISSLKNLEIISIAGNSKLINNIDRKNHLKLRILKVDFYNSYIIENFNDVIDEKYKSNNIFKLV